RPRPGRRGGTSRTRAGAYTRPKGLQGIAGGGGGAAAQVGGRGRCWSRPTPVGHPAPGGYVDGPAAAGLVTVLAGTKPAKAGRENAGRHRLRLRSAPAARPSLPTV